MSESKTTIDLPFSPEDVRMGRHLGNAIAGYRDGDFKRSAEGMVEAVRAFQAAADEIDLLRAEVAEYTKLKEYAKSLGQRTYLELHAENERLREALRVFIKFLDGGSNALMPFETINKARTLVDPLPKGDKK